MSAAPSLAERTRRVAAGTPVVGLHFLGEIAVCVLGEEALLFVETGREPERVVAHAGAILTSACDGKRVLTGGDDGTIAATRAGRKPDVAASDAKRRWIDHVAIAPDGTIAWSAGKDAFVEAKGGRRRFEAPSTVGGLAFAPKGLRLAVAHYHGVTLWFPNAAQAAPERLEWKGSHIAATFSPDGRFLVTAMQEPALHGWRLADGANMRMSGYAAKVGSLSWSGDGKWLATSGAAQLVIWPFHGKDGPMGKQPLVLASAANRIETVACHPTQPAVAVGYADGLLLLVRTTDGAELPACRPAGSPISALAWSDGGTLAFGTEAGEVGIIDLASRP